MTQEILDYLLIKAQFVGMTSDELLECMKLEENFEIYCDIICQVIEHDDFFYTSPKLIEKLATIVHTKRFEGVHKKETIADLNEMLEVINTYKNLSDSQKLLLTANWINKQAEIRKLPYRKFPGYDLERIYQFLYNEKYYADMILTQQLTDASIYNQFYCLGTINMLINEFPQVFENGDCLSYAYSLSMLLQTKLFKNKYHTYSKMAKDTMLSLEKIEEQFQTQVTKKYQFNIEKR